jgi:NTE family protein
LTVLQVAPSVNLTEVAAQHQKDMPYLIQYFVNSLGRDAASCSDLMSYLLFTPKYTRELINLGYHDADRRIDEIEDYLFSPDNGDSKGVVAAPRNGKSREAESASRRTTSAARSRG